MAPNLFLYALPAFLMMIVAEMWYSWKEDAHLYERNDAKTNIIIGLGCVFTGALVKAVMIAANEFAYEWRLFTLPESWWVLPVAFLAADLSFYWFHRASHHINLMWAHHSVHHSSEQYNITVAFRIPWTNVFSGVVLFWAWMPLLGFDPLLVFFLYQVILLYQSWLHTKAIKRVPALIDFLFNTPSHHRVHHASNERYLDKNHGGILIIWDRLFGTFQAEVEMPVYGLAGKRPRSGPLTVAFGEFISIFRKCRKSGTLRGVLGYLFLRPGWSHTSATPSYQHGLVRNFSKNLKMTVKRASAHLDYHLALKSCAAEMPERFGHILKGISAIDYGPHFTHFKQRYHRFHPMVYAVRQHTKLPPAI